MNTVNNHIVLQNVSNALSEDVGSGDVSSALLPSTLRVDADIISREPMLLCGQPWVNEVFLQVDPSTQIEWLHKEGTWLETPQTVCRIQGLAKSILTAERAALNFLQTLSATATETYRFIQKIKHTSVRLLDTRKTIPGLRYAQKYAVHCAGGNNHRMGLYDAFLIKENHIMACGSITQAIQKARAMDKDLLVEVEVETLEELQEAFAAFPDRILLDNFSHEMLQKAVAMNIPHRCDLEASGGIHLGNIAEVAETGVDFISVGSITKSIQAIDLSLLIRTTS